MNLPGCWRPRRARSVLLLLCLGALGGLPAGAAANDCGPPDPSRQVAHTNGWGIDLAATRLQRQTSITRKNVGRLRLRFAYGLATDEPRSWPLVTADTIYIADRGRGLVALDRATGCQRWLLERAGNWSTAIQLGADGTGTPLLYVADRMTNILAVEAITGQIRWQSQPADSVAPMFSGSPLLYNQRLYVPISSLEIGMAINPLYGCCTTSGAMAALDARSGDRLWHFRVIAEAAQVTGRHWLFVEEWGPSGAPVWGAPSFDRDRNQLYFGTGQNYSHPTTTTSDSIFALNADTGAVVWHRQFTANDAYNMACSVRPGHPNCPDPPGPDIDFGAPPMLTQDSAGRPLLIAGQKSGDVYALSPDTGEILWQRDLGRGGALGGVHWGMAANPDSGVVYVPISDIDAFHLTSVDDPRPGLVALDAATGETLWTQVRKSRSPARADWGGISAAITATPELVFSASMDGYLEAVDARNGNLLFSHDSRQNFTTVNAVAARGGTYDTHGPLVVDDLVIAISGYGTFGEAPGNALLVFELPPAVAP